MQVHIHVVNKTNAGFLLQLLADVRAWHTRHPMAPYNVITEWIIMHIQIFKLILNDKVVSKKTCIFHTIDHNVI